MGLVDRTCIPGDKASALADAGVKYIFTGHAGQLSISDVTTTNGAECKDIMSGSLVNASAGIRYTTLYKAVSGMKEQAADTRTDMINSAAGVADIEASAHASLKKQMSAEVDYAINTAENVIAYLIPAMKPNIQQLVRDIDLAVLVPDMAGLFNVLGGTISSVKNDLANQYVGPLFDILSNRAKLHAVIVDVRSALEKMDFNGQDFYSFLTDVFVTLQKCDGKTPDSVEGFFKALRDKQPELLTGVINSFADNFNSANLINLLNEVLDLQFHKKYIGTLQVNVHLRGLLAGPYALTSGLYTYNLDLWGILDGLATLPNGKTISAVARPLVNDLLLGGENDASTKQTPERFKANLKKDAEGVVNLLFDFGVGDLIGANVFAQNQNADMFAKTITLAELGQKLTKLVPNAGVTSVNSADWRDVQDVLRSYWRFTPEQLATVNVEFTAATDTAAAVTQLSILQSIVNNEYYQAVANDFTVRVNNLPATEQLTLDNSAEVRTLKYQYNEFFDEIRSKLAPATVVKLNGAFAKIYALETYDGAVEAVKEKIDAIGAVTVESEADIADARTAYDALTIRQKKAVTNYDVLVAAEAALKLAKENAVVIAAVEQKISAIGEVAFNATCKAKINIARSAYDSLADELKPSVSNYEVLTAAEARYEELRAAAEDQIVADPVIAKINAIGTVTLESKRLIEAAEAAYASLTPSQQKLVINYQVLVDARAEYNRLLALAEGNKAAADAVIEKIGAIGTVTLESGNAISEARAAYNALTGEQQSLVINYNTLVNAEKTFAALQQGALNKEAADKVIAKIDSIGDVTIEKESLITEARDSYNALTTEQKRLVTNLNVLIAAESQLSILKNDFLFEDGATGIALRAASGVVPLDTVMRVTVIESGKIYDAVTKEFKSARVYKIELVSGGNAVTPAKDVDISIPQFAFDTKAYAVTDGGELAEINAAAENGSLNFTSAAVGCFAVVRPNTALDTASLEEAIAKYESLNVGNYTDASAEEAKVDYEAAQAVLNANYAVTAENQRKADEAAQSLLDAIDLLEYKNADMKALYMEILNAKAYVKADYTDFTQVDALLEEAVEFVKVPRTILYQAEADRLTAELKKACGELTLAPADFKPIDDAINSIPKDLQNYSPETVEALEKAKAAAEEAKKTITRDDVAWQSEVEKVAGSVRAAIAGLQRKDVVYADVSYLKVACEIVSLYNPKDYADFADVETALSIGKAILTDEVSETRQSEVDSAANAIYRAIESLIWL